MSFIPTYQPCFHLLLLLNLGLCWIMVGHIIKCDAILLNVNLSYFGIIWQYLEDRVIVVRHFVYFGMCSEKTLIEFIKLIVLLAVVPFFVWYLYIFQSGALRVHDST